MLSMSMSMSMSYLCVIQVKIFCRKIDNEPGGQEV